MDTASKLRAIAVRLDEDFGVGTHDAEVLRTIADELDGEQVTLRERLSGIARLVDYALDALEPEANVRAPRKARG